MTSKSTFAYEFVRKPQEEIDDALASNPQILEDIDESQRFVLHWAALAGKDQLCEHILRRHPMQRDAEDDTKATPLILAALGGDLPTVTLLVRAGADLNHRKNGGHSALQYACSKRKREVTNYLLEVGADPNIVDDLGDTPLHRVAGLGYTETVDMLLSHGANPNLQNLQGDTPLHVACESDEQSCAILLLKRGASRNILNRQEQNPLDLASRSLITAIANEVGFRHAG